MTRRITDAIQVGRLFSQNRVGLTSAKGDALPRLQRDKNIALWAHNISAAGVPWLYWQVLPNADPHYVSRGRLPV